MWYKGIFLYLATVLDLYTREILGWHILTAHTSELVHNTLTEALHTNKAPPKIHHSDQGSEYRSKEYTGFLKGLGVRISMSRQGSPWENGYQEAFYSQFKVDLGDPIRFETRGELVYEIHKTIYWYNHERIHSALKMPPSVFARRMEG